MDKKQRFLKIIKQIESSGGKNTNHKTMEEGIHKGQAAEGVYGIMPNTKKELERRFPTKKFESDSDYASKLADIVLKKAGGDEAVAAGLWNQGHNFLNKKSYDAIARVPVDEKKELIKKNINYKKYEHMLPEAIRRDVPYEEQDEIDFERILNILGKG